VFVVDRKIDCGTIAWRGSTFCGASDDNRVGKNITCATPSRALEIRFTAVALLQSAPSSAIRFVSHLYQARREYRQTCQTAGKSGKHIQMHGHPTLGVKNAKPRLSSKPGPQIGKLSEEYLTVRNAQMRTKNLAAEMQLAERREYPNISPYQGTYTDHPSLVFWIHNSAYS
jgi:hypothetical protein